MGLLEGGRWDGGVQAQIGARGHEPRQEHLRATIRSGPDDGAGGYEAEAGRYRLVLCPGCPMSHVIWLAHAVNGLDEVLPIIVTRDVMGPNGRELAPPGESDPATGHRYLYELYLATDPSYTGRDSTPVLWDRRTRRIVTNAYEDVLEAVNGPFRALAGGAVDLRPPELSDEIAEMRARVGQGIAGAVYKCGFARDQASFDENIARLVAALPEFDARLSDSDYLLGDRVTEPDLTLHSALVRYDAIYAVLFRCTTPRVESFPGLTAHIRRIMGLPGASGAFDLDRAMAHYYRSHLHIGPTGIVPPAPPLSWWPPGAGAERAR